MPGTVVTHARDGCNTTVVTHARDGCNTCQGRLQHVNNGYFFSHYDKKKGKLSNSKATIFEWGFTHRPTNNEQCWASSSSDESWIFCFFFLLLQKFMFLFALDLFALDFLFSALSRFFIGVSVRTAVSLLFLPFVVCFLSPAFGCELQLHVYSPWI